MSLAATDAQRANTILKHREKFPTANYSNYRGLCTEPLAFPNSSAPVSERHAYIADLKDRLKKSWAAGLPALTLTSSPENHVYRKEVLTVLASALAVLKTEPNVVSLSLSSLCFSVKTKQKTITVVGDTHGQFYDVLKLLTLAGEPSESHAFIFNGDFCDRGSFSVQTVLLLLAYKALFPNFVFLTRGNHETVDMNILYGFFHEVVAKYDTDVAKAFWQSFDYLPLAVTVESIKIKALILHGGLFSDETVDLEYVKSIKRHELFSSNYALRAETKALSSLSSNNKVSKEETAMHDLLWSDPSEQKGRKHNRHRNGGLMFGPDVTEDFLNKNNLDILIRSHQVKREGFGFMHNKKCLTVFSAPNYCDSVGNKAAFINFVEYQSGNNNKNSISERESETESSSSSDEREIAKVMKDDRGFEIIQFEATEHPKLPIMAHLHYYKKARL